MASLETRKIATLIKNGSAARITLLTGAGASVNSGIPDFRSPGGMYDTLKPDVLTATQDDKDLMSLDPVYVVEKEMFMRNPLPYHEVRRPFILGTAKQKWKPTIAQMFARLLHDNGILLRLYTQNIDGLDFDVGIPEDRIVCVHGSIRQTTCESCHTDPYNGNYQAYVADVKAHIKDIYNVDPSAPQHSKPIACSRCNCSTVKPTTVLYGGTMPSEFSNRSSQDFGEKGVFNWSPGPKSRGKVSDMMFIIGTSLTVFPAAFLPDCLEEGRPRVLVNWDAAGSFDYSSRDYWLKGDIDRALLDLIVEIGWLDQLVVLKHRMCESSQQLVEEVVGNRASQNV